MVLLAVSILYARGFDGFWLGDDVANLHLLYALDQQGQLLSGTLSYFSSGLSPQGSLFRPLSMVSMSANYLLANDWYPGWYAINLMVHLANTLFVALLVRRLADRCGTSSRVAAPVAAAFFGLAPSLAEGVFWISARADGWVTFLGLAGTLAWCGRKGGVGAKAAWLPTLMVPALLFKESAAVLPLQVALLALAWPGRTSTAQRVALASSFAIMVAFLVIRAQLFGSAWHVYSAPGTTVAGPSLDGLCRALGSLMPWWQTLGEKTPLVSLLYPLALGGCLLLSALSVRNAHARFALALLCASGGLALATMLNVGVFAETGEGGRLTYTPLAWLAASVGIALSARIAAESHGWRLSIHHLALCACVLSVVLGALALHGILGAAHFAQSQMHTITSAMAHWAKTHDDGLTVFVLPERIGPVITARHAQGGLAMPPLQGNGILHRVLPTLPSELEKRHKQLANGLATRLESSRLQFLDMKRLLALVEPDVATWPQHVVCWSHDGHVLPLATAAGKATEAWQMPSLSAECAG